MRISFDDWDEARPCARGCGGVAGLGDVFCEDCRGGELVRAWHGQVAGHDVSLSLFDLNERHAESGHHRMGYVFAHDGEVIFTGDDYGVPAHQSVDSDAAVAGLLGFLSLRPGDTDAEYFDSYTDRQREWSDQHGEELASYADRDALAGEGEAPTMDAALAVLLALRQVADGTCARVDQLAASLRSAELDPRTLGQVAEVLDAADRLRNAASTALTGLQARHSQMHEAVNNTGYAAVTDWYRHS